MSEREKKMSPMQKALQMRQARMQRSVTELKNEVRRFHRAHEDVFGSGAVTKRDDA